MGMLFEVLILLAGRPVGRADADVELAVPHDRYLAAVRYLEVNAREPGVAVAFPQVNVALFDAVRNNDRERAVACYDRISRIREIMTGYGSRPISFYSLLRRMGMDAGHSREPWYPLEEDKADEMYARLQEISAFSPIESGV